MVAEKSDYQNIAQGKFPTKRDIIPHYVYLLFIATFLEKYKFHDIRYNTRAIYTSVTRPK